MPSSRIWSAIILASLALSAGTASGQTLVARYSKINYNYVFGAGGDSHVGGDMDEEFDPLLSDTGHLDFEDSTSGVLPGGTPYTAGTSADLDFAYAITGTISEVKSITLTSDTEVTGAVSGAGIAQMNAANEGNHLRLELNLANHRNYRLVGVISSTQPGFATYVVFQVFDGFSWVSLFNSILLPGSAGPFEISGTLPPGQYRIVSGIASGANGNQISTGSIQYTLSFSRRADMNCDGRIDGLDIQAFADALLLPATYDARNPTCNELNGDFDNNNVVTSADVAPFTQCVLNGGC